MPAWSRVRWLAALGIVPLLLFGPILAAGEVFLPYLPTTLEPLRSENPVAADEAAREANWVMGDRVFPFLTDQISARRELLHGRLPTWEPHQSLGMPLLGGQITGLAYPPSALGLALPPERAAAPLAMLALLLAGLGMVLFLLRQGLDPRAALVGALAYQLGGWGLSNLFYYMKVDSALWLPWALWAVDGWLARKRWSALALVAALGLSALGAMVTVTAFVGLATGAYAAWRLIAPSVEPHQEPHQEPHREPRQRARDAAALAFLALLGVAAGALQLLPLADAGRASLRTEMSTDGVVELALPVATTLGIVVPDLAGSPTDSTTRGGRSPLAWMLTPGDQAQRAELANALEWNTYALLTAALLALVGVVATPRRAALPATLVVLTLAFSQAWPGLRPFYALPGLGLGAPGRVLAVTWALWPWLAALGVDALVRRAPRALGTALTGAFVVSVAAFLAWRAVEPVAFPERLVAALSERFGQTDEAVRAAFPPASLVFAGQHLHEALGRTFAVGLALLVAGLGALFLDRSRPGFEGGPGWGPTLLACALPAACVALSLGLGQGVAGRGAFVVLGAAGVVALAAVGLRSEGSSGASRAVFASWFPLLTVLVLEGFLGAAPHIRGRSILSDGLFPPSPAITAVAAAAGDARVLRYDPTPDLGASARLARPNLLVPYGIRELTPYVSLAPREPVELFRALDPRMEHRNYVASLPDLRWLDHPLLDLMRVGVVLAVEPLSHPRLQPAFEQPGFHVYRRTGALPPARIVPHAESAADDATIVRALVDPAADPGERTWIAPADADDLEAAPLVAGWRPGTIAIERPSAARVRAAVRDSSGGWLVLHEQWARGWRATVNGTSVRVRRADHAYRAVAIPPGDCTVEFRYDPPALRRGFWLTLSAFAGVFLWELLNRRSAPAP